MMSERCWCTSYTVRATLWHLAGSLIGATHLPVPGPAPPRTSATLCGPRSIYMHPSIPFHCSGKRQEDVENEESCCWSNGCCCCCRRRNIADAEWLGAGGRTLITPPAAFICIALHCKAVASRSFSSSLLSLFTLINARRFCLN